MKTHELAATLIKVAKALNSMPNIDVSDFNQAFIRKPKQSAAGIEVNIATLASLSRIDKRQWLDLIVSNRFPIDIRPRDASRDILGKLLKFLEETPEAVQHLKRPRNVSASPELMRALDVLLKDRNS